MIRYPYLPEGATIAVSAPSSGVDSRFAEQLRQAIARKEREGFSVVCGDTLWKQHKAKSAPARERAAELNGMMLDGSVDFIFPPWGGELLIEILEHLSFEQFGSKWIMGYSDISLLLLAVTLTTGIATAHGPNLFDMHGERSDGVTARWLDVLRTKPGGTVAQHASDSYQKEWSIEQALPHVFHLTERTVWKTVREGDCRMEGRLLGGCIDVIRHLAGTPFGDVRRFQQTYIGNDPIVWYFENCELNTADQRRSFVGLKLAGWFDNCAGLLFGRSARSHPVGEYTEEDMYRELADELGVPIVYDIDVGHVPPQVTLVNGAFAKVEVKEGKGSVEQSFI